MGTRLDVQELLEIRELQLREAMQIACMGTWEWDVPAGVVTWSPELRRILGVENDLPGTARNFLDLVHPEDRPWAERAMHESLRTGITYNIPFRIVRPDGTTRIVRGRAVTTRFEDGKPVHMVGVIQDMGSGAACGDFAEESALLERMSERERQVLDQVVRGSTSKEIAAALHLSPKTVDSYRSRLMAKIGVEDLVGLLRFSIRHGLTLL
jgi:PAS domain S-box-containing protein